MALSGVRVNFAMTHVTMVVGREPSRLQVENGLHLNEKPARCISVNIA